VILASFNGEKVIVSVICILKKKINRVVKKMSLLENPRIQLSLQNHYSPWLFEFLIFIRGLILDLIFNFILK
jgi:hypothetical protein